MNRYYTHTILLVVAGLLLPSLVLAGNVQEAINRPVASLGQEMASLEVPEEGLSGFDPVPIVAGLEKNIKSIHRLIQKEKPRRDRLVLRCLNEKWKQAKGQRSNVVALIPGLAELTAGPGSARGSLASKLSSLQPQLGREEGKSLLVAARTVEKLAAEARMCQRITDGLVPQYGATLALGKGTNPDDVLPALPDNTDLPPEDIMAPVSEIHRDLTP